LPLYYDTFVNSLRSLYAQDTSKGYYVSAAPKCVYPDASVGTALTNSHFDMVFVQFYNNYCGAASGASFNYGTWDTWAKSSPNPNVKVFIGVPAAPAAAGSGYITPAALSTLVASVKSKYSSLGGVMMWDASESSANVINKMTYAQNAKAALGGSVSSASSASNGVIPGVSLIAAPILVMMLYLFKG
jgi:chitinase